MKKSSYTNYEELPLFLNAEFISEILGISISSAYELMHEKDFPTLKVGNRMVVPKEKFRMWVEKNTGGGSQLHRNSNYFLVPNEVFILGLDHGELSVYLYLLYCEDRTTYQCHPSYNTIGEAIGMSKKTVQKYVRSLENKHLISTEYTTITTKDGRTRNGSLLYTIFPMKDALQYYYETKFREIADEKLRRKIEEKLRRFNIDL